MTKKKGTKTETTTATVVEASPSNDDSLVEHINDLIASSTMMNDAFMELINTSKVDGIMKILERALENANTIQESLREAKTSEGVKDISRYFGYFDIALPGTISDIPAEDTEWGHGPSKAEDIHTRRAENSRYRGGKALLRVYSQLEKPVDPRSNPFREGGCAVLLSRGTSVTQTKGNRLYQGGFIPSNFIDLVGSLSTEEANKVWVLLAAGYRFNEEKRVTGSAVVASSIDVKNIKEIDLSELD